MRNLKYVLDGHTPVPATLMEWAKWFETADRHVAATTLEDGTYISTVFLGLDHNYGPSGPPLLFETMIFANPDENMIEEYCERYATWDEAAAGHERAVAWAKAERETNPKETEQ